MFKKIRNKLLYEILSATLVFGIAGATYVYADEFEEIQQEETLQDEEIQEEVINEDILPEESVLSSNDPSDISNIGSYKLNLTLANENGFIPSNNMVIIHINCNDAYERYIVYTSPTGEEGTYTPVEGCPQGYCWEANNMMPQPEWTIPLELDDGIDPVTRNSRECYMYVIARDDEKKYPDAKSNIMKLSPTHQIYPMNNDFDSVVALQYASNGTYRKIDRLVIHEGEDLRIGFGMEKNGVITPGISHSYTRPGNAIVTYWHLVDAKNCMSYNTGNVLKLENVSEIAGYDDYYVYLEGLKATNHRYLSNDEARASAEPKSDNYLFITYTTYDSNYSLISEGWVGLPITVLPAEPGVTYNTVKHDNYYHNTQEFFDGVRSALASRKTDNASGVSLIATSNNILNGLDLWDGAYDFYEERSDMDPAEGDYLRSTIDPSFTPSYTSSLKQVGYMGYFEYIVKAKHLTTKAQEEQVDSLIDGLFLNDATLSGAKNWTSNDAKSKAAYDYVTSHITKTTETTAKYQTTYNALLGDKKANSYGMAVTYERLCREMGVPTRLIHNDDFSRVYAITLMDDGCYYYVDPAEKSYGRTYSNFSRTTEAAKFSNSQFLINYASKIKNYGSAPSGQPVEVEASFDFSSNPSLKLYFRNYGLAQYVQCIYEDGKKQLLYLFPSTDDVNTSTVIFELPAKKLNSTLSFKLLDANYREIEVAAGYGIDTYSMQDYYDGLVKRGGADQRLLNFIKATMVYSDCADNYFNGAKHAIPDMSSVTADKLKKYERRITGSNSTFKYVGSSLYLGGTIRINHYFSSVNGRKSGFEITSNRYGNWSGVADGYDNGMFIGYDSIYAPTFLDEAYTYRVKDPENGNYINIEYSPMSYVYSVLARGVDDDLTQLAKALYLYSQASEEYFAYSWSQTW